MKRDVEKFIALLILVGGVITAIFIVINNAA